MTSEDIATKLYAQPERTTNVLKLECTEYISEIKGLQ